MSIKITVPPVTLEADKKDLNRVLRQAGQEIAGIARNLIRKSVGTGITRGGHTASAPGEAPANKTGALAKAINVSVKGGTLTVIDRNSASLALEAGGVGTKRRGGKDKNGRMAANWVLQPRPFLTTALEQVEGDLGERIGRAINQGIHLKDVKPR